MKRKSSMILSQQWWRGEATLSLFHHSDIFAWSIWYLCTQIHHSDVFVFVDITQRPGTKDIGSGVEWVGVRSVSLRWRNSGSRHTTSIVFIASAIMTWVFLAPLALLSFLRWFITIQEQWLSVSWTDSRSHSQVLNKVSTSSIALSINSDHSWKPSAWDEIQPMTFTIPFIRRWAKVFIFVTFIFDQTQR